MLVFCVCESCIHTAITWNNYRVHSIGMNRFSHVFAEAILSNYRKFFFKSNNFYFKYRFFSTLECPPKFINVIICYGCECIHFDSSRSSNSHIFACWQCTRLCCHHCAIIIICLLSSASVSSFFDILSATPMSFEFATSSASYLLCYT